MKHLRVISVLVAMTMILSASATLILSSNESDAHYEYGPVPTSTKINVGEEYKFDMHGNVKDIDVATKPEWMNITNVSDTHNVFQGTPTRADIYNLVFTYKERVSISWVPRSVNITIEAISNSDPSAPIISTGPAPSSTTLYVNQPYKYTMDPNVKDFSITSKPSWISHESSNNNTQYVFQGMPTQPGTYNLSFVYLKQTNSIAFLRMNADITFTVVQKTGNVEALVENGPVPTSSTLYTGQMYKYTMDQNVKSFSITSKPSWLSHESSNNNTQYVFQGMPTQPGTYNLSFVYLKNTSGAAFLRMNADITFTVVSNMGDFSSFIEKGPVPTSTTLHVNQAYKYTVDQNVKGFEITSKPSWLSHESSNNNTQYVFQGMPTQPGTYNLSFVYLKNTSGAAFLRMNANITFTVIGGQDFVKQSLSQGACPTNTSLEVGQSYKYTMDPNVKEFSITSKPSWLSHESSNNNTQYVFQGMPTQPGTYNLSFTYLKKVNSIAFQRMNADVTFTVYGKLNFTSEMNIGDLLAGEPFSYRPQTNVTSTITLESSGTNANWISMNGGVLSGNAPNVAGNTLYCIKMKATAPMCATIYLTLYFYVSPILTIDHNYTIYAIPDRAFEVGLSSNIPAFWSSIDIPQGASISPSGLISGTITEPGTYTFTVNVSSSVGKTQILNSVFKIVVMQDLGITPAAPSDFYVETFLPGAGGNMSNSINGAVSVGGTYTHKQIGNTFFQSVHYTGLWGPDWLKFSIGSNQSIFGTAPAGSEGTYIVEVAFLRVQGEYSFDDTFLFTLTVEPPEVQEIEFDKTVGAGEQVFIGVNSPHLKFGTVLDELPSGLSLAYYGLEGEDREIFTIYGVPVTEGIYQFEWRIFMDFNEYSIIFTLTVTP